jgi:hypothetical protein
MEESARDPSPSGGRTPRDRPGQNARTARRGPIPRSAWDSGRSRSTGIPHRERSPVPSEHQNRSGRSPVRGRCRHRTGTRATTGRESLRRRPRLHRRSEIDQERSAGTVPRLFVGGVNRSRSDSLTRWFGDRSHRIASSTLTRATTVVDAIESYLTRLDAAVATLERVERNLKRYRASVLKSAVEGRLVPTEAALARQEGRDYEPASVLLERILTERRRRWSQSGEKSKYEDPAPPDTTNLPALPEGWCWASLEAVTDPIRVICYGILMPKDNVADGIPYVKVRDTRSEPSTFPSCSAQRRESRRGFRGQS